MRSCGVRPGAGRPAGASLYLRTASHGPHRRHAAPRRVNRAISVISCNRCASIQHVPQFHVEPAAQPSASHTRRSVRPTATRRSPHQPIRAGFWFQLPLPVFDFTLSPVAVPQNRVAVSPCPLSTHTHTGRHTISSADPCTPSSRRHTEHEGRTSTRGRALFGTATRDSARQHRTSTSDTWRVHCGVHGRDLVAHGSHLCVFLRASFCR